MPILGQQRHNARNAIQPWHDCADMKRLLQLTVLVSVLVLTACSHMLPRAQNESTPFESFDAAQSAIESLVPMHSTLDTLTRLGLNPAQQPNIVILTPDDIVRRFVPSNMLKREDLDPGVLACINAKEACRGWSIAFSRVNRARTGGFFLDFTNFRRRTETTGWRFTALVLLVNDTVVYRQWGGQPNVREVEVNTNPLGPLQELGPALITNH